jgi:hypothetical protein
LVAEAGAAGGITMVVDDDSAGAAGAPGDPAAPGAPAGPGTGTTVVDEDGAGAVLGGFTTVVFFSHALSAAAAAINAAICMSLLFIWDSRCRIGVTGL